MKNSSEWVRQPEVDQAADAILAEGKTTLETITAYQVGDRLDRSANPSMYAKFRDWRSRRRAEAEPIAVDVPPEAEANIRAIFMRLTDEGVDACLGAVRVVGGNLDRVAMLRIGDAERRADKAEAETADVVAIGEKIEEALSAATTRIDELEQLIANAQRREDRLTGRLEQREADLAAALKSRACIDTTPAGAPPRDCADDAYVVVARDAGDGDANDGDAGDRSTDVSVPSDSSPAVPAAQLRLTFARIKADDDGGHDAH